MEETGVKIRARYQKKNKWKQLTKTGENPGKTNKNPWKRNE